MSRKAAKEIKPHVEAYDHRDCRPCSGSGGYYASKADHDSCTGKCCGITDGYGGEAIAPCEGPCPCRCNQPLSRDEIMDIRDLIERLRR